MATICFYDDPGSVYPVLDPRRIAGALPQQYGYALAWDGIMVTVEEDFSLSNCEMLVGLAADRGITWRKEIHGWNYCTGASVSSVGTQDGNHGPNFMLVQRANDFSGAHTLLFKKAMVFGHMTGLYTLQSDDFWTFWGGMKVTFTWERDDAGSNVWGSDTPEPTYPIVAFPDGTLVRSIQQPGIVFIVFGGAKFRLDPANSLGLDLSTAQLIDIGLIQNLPSAPVDGTILKEVGDANVFVFFGGAKFLFPHPDPRHHPHRLVSQVPPGGLANIPVVPRHGTLLKEQSDAKVFLVKHDPAHANQLRWVTSPAVFDSLCLSSRNVRTVPDGSLGALPRGPDLV